MNDTNANDPIFWFQELKIFFEIVKPEKENTATDIDNIDVPTLWMTYIYGLIFWFSVSPSNMFFALLNSFLVFSTLLVVL